MMAARPLQTAQLRRGLRSAVIDDSETIRALVARTMRARGHLMVEEFGDAAVALHAHQSNPFALMVVDWVLPGMDGLELCREVRRAPGGDAVAILVVTGRDRNADLQTILDAGATDYLAKPIDETMLHTRLAVAERAAANAARRVAAENALRESEANLAALIENTQDAVWSVDKELRIVTMNSAARSLLSGAIRRELGPGEKADVLPASTQLYLRRALRGEQFCVDERYDLGGRLVEIETSFSPIRAGLVRATGVTVFSRDISERSRFQAQLLHADRLASMGTLAGGVAHEINNPLGYVSANLEFIEEQMVGRAFESSRESRGEILDAIKEAKQGVSRVRQIVGDLSQFARTESETVSLVDVRRILETAIQMTSNELRHRACVIRDFDSIPLVAANEGRLCQVFVNLLLNAAHALPDGQASSHSVTVRTKMEEGRVLIEIIDTGHGIAPEVIARIFDPFFTTKPVGVGTGLGLSICHGIITRLGGEITVESKNGAGTVFRVRLPVAEKGKSVRVPGEIVENPPDLPSPRRARILIIDDEPLIGRSLQRALARHEVTVVAQAREGLDLLRSHSYDLVLCDLMMPDVSGMDLYAQLRSELPDIAARVVFMTGGAFTARIREFLETISNQCLEKPFPVEKIRVLVRDRLN